MLRSAILFAVLTATCSLASAAEVASVEVGKRAPDFTVTGIDGKRFKLSDKLKDGDTNVALMFSRANW